MRGIKCTLSSTIMMVIRFFKLNCEYKQPLISRGCNPKMEMYVRSKKIEMEHCSEFRLIQISDIEINCYIQLNF